MRLLFSIVLIFSFQIAAFCGDEIRVGSVQTLSGYVSGWFSDDQKVKIFMGIPFAAPPVGELRWKAPQPVKHWEGIRPCISFPASAMQPVPKPLYCWTKEFMAPEEPLSEDCLYLNIWTPAKSSKDKLPVMVWIHGGGFNGGSGTVPLYNGEAMARKGILFITINYRLGIFGFLAHPELSAESENHTSGNYGILDQIAALKWVQNNIAAFGGDPGNVTIAGQSAGAISVNLLVDSPFANDLFHKAIAESGGMFGRNYGILKDAENAGLQITKRFGIASIRDLRKISADSLLKIGGHFGITIDNVVIPPINETFAAGKYNKVPLLTGWNADDGVSFGPAATANQFKTNIQRKYGKHEDEVLQMFPANNDQEAAQSQKLLSQLGFGWQNFSWARMQKANVYLYFFKRVPPGKPDYGAFHSAEFGYALHTLNRWDRPFTNVDYSLEEIMSSYWVNFAKTGNPNSKGLPKWPRFDDKNPQAIILGDEVKAGPVPFLQQLRFMDGI